MSLLKSTLDSPSVAIPFRVRLEPYLVESICELSRLVRDKGGQHSDISGLLFGKADAGNRTVEALKTFADVGTHSELARRERWEKAYKSTLEESKNDPELSAMEVVGWFSLRTGSGLLSGDVVFHNQHFRKPEDLAVIVWREGPSQITAEIYSKSENDTLTSDDYRWGSVRLSADIRHMREAVELAMRVKLSDDSYLRTYDSGEPPSQLEILRRKAEAVSEKLLGFLYRRSKEEAYAERIRGYIGDGRLLSQPTPGPESEQRPLSPPAYFNPYLDVAQGRTRLGSAEAERHSAVPASVGASSSAPSWPASGAAFATAAARSPDPGPDLRLTESRFPPAPPVPSALEFGNIGRAPRTGRIPQAEVSGLPMVLRPVAIKKSFPWLWAAGLFVVCSGLVFAFLALGGLQSDGGRFAQVFKSVFPDGELNLRVRTEDDRLRLTWNQRNHAVESASGAMLQIFDGQQHRDIHLDAQQVADGSVLYRAVTNDVTFRLEVRGDQGATSGSVRVLDGLSGQRPVLDVSAAPTAPAVPIQSAAARVPSYSDSAMPSNTPSAGKDAADAALIGKNAGAEAAKSPDPNYAPITETPIAPDPSISTHQTSQQKLLAPRYETPQTVGTPYLYGGSTINGWDTTTAAPPAKSRNKQRTSTPVSSRPVSSTPGLSNAGYVAPRPLMQVMPNTRAIPNGTILARTRVEVQVDVNQVGHVSSAHLVSTGVNDKISSAALSAALKWTFDPASNNGQRVNSEHTIVFEFRPEH